MLLFSIATSWSTSDKLAFQSSYECMYQSWLTVGVEAAISDVRCCSHGVGSGGRFRLAVFPVYERDGSRRVVSANRRSKAVEAVEAIFFLLSFAGGGGR